MLNDHIVRKTIVSVIMPAFNCEKYITQAIESILNQSYTNIELIIINDGSTDNTLSIIKEFATRDSRISVIDQNNAGKPSIVRNVGIKHAQGEFVCFLDADDLYDLDKIQIAMDVFNALPESGVVFHDVKYIDEIGGALDGTYLKNAGFGSSMDGQRIDSKEGSILLCNSHSLFFFMCMNITTILMSSIMLRREVLLGEKSWFSEKLAIGEDVDLWFRIVPKHKIIFLDRVLSFYRQYGASITKSNLARFTDPIISHVINYQRCLDYLTEHEKIEYRRKISNSFFDAGYNLYQQGYDLKALRFYYRSLAWFPSTHKLYAVTKAVVRTLIPRALLARHA